MDDYTAEQLTESLLGIVEELTLIRRLLERLTPLIDERATVAYKTNHKEAFGDDREGQGGGTD